MNIGIVTVWHDRGAAFVSKAYLNTLTPENNVFIYARGGEIDARGDETWNKSYVTWGKRVHLGIPSFIIWKDFKEWILRNHLDTIIFNEQHSWDVILRSIKMGIKIGAYVDYYKKETFPFFGLYDFLLCNTQRHYSVFKDHPQAFYIPWGTDCAIYAEDCKPVSDKEVIFFHSCGMNPWRKGTDVLVKAFQGVKGSARLIIHSQVPIIDSVLANPIKADSRIEVIVKTVGPPGLYHLGDVYVYPTRLEGIGLTIAEALASGLPVITVDNAPMNEFVVDGINGRLVPVSQYQQRWDKYYWDECLCNDQDLMQAMQFYVDHQQKIEEYKHKARNYAIEKLNWRINSAGLSKIIHDSGRLIKPDRLIRETAFYEYSSYPGLVASALLRKLKIIR
ncbi:MAG: glycosyltransferase family 4 protein [Bellilinea sp.]